jgi:hypothetical protein
MVVRRNEASFPLAGLTVFGCNPLGRIESYRFAEGEKEEEGTERG